MSSTFIGLPLASGEAFLLKTWFRGATRTILVDSGYRKGRKRHTLVDAIQDVEPAIHRIDIAICTHQDSDHTNGFLNFAEYWCGKEGKQIGEFWLPGRWASSFPKSLFDPIAYAADIQNGADEIARSYIDFEGSPDREGLEKEHSLYTLDEKLRELDRQHRTDLGVHENIASGTWADHVENAAFKTDFDYRRESLARALGVSSESLDALCTAREEGNWESVPDRETAQKWFRHLFLRELRGWRRGDELIASAIRSRAVETANTIAKIALSAVDYNIPIRWFDFGEFERTKKTFGGIAGFCVPANSVELSRPPRVRAETLVYDLLLTRQNVESLVFLRPEKSSEPAVLFVGDSRLAFGISRPIRDFPRPVDLSNSGTMIVTAPHHGSHINDHAYSVLEDWLQTSRDANGQNLIFVRNGGRSDQNFGAFFSQPSRYCVQCSAAHQKRRVAAVRVQSSNGRWDKSIPAVPCGCDWRVNPGPRRKKTGKNKNSVR